MPDIKVTVIIPCYNAAKFIDRCWNSLQKQTIGIDNIQCIFVNDCSTDQGKTLEKLQEVEQNAPNSVVVVDLESNVGPGEARNIGLNYAEGEYIQFFDADDELDENALKLLYETASENQADIIQFNHLYILGDIRKSSGNSKEDKLYVIQTKEDRIPFLNSSIVTYGCTNKFMKTSLIRNADVRFPEKAKYEEPLFIYPLFLYASRVYILNRDLYLYYFNPGSMVTSELGKKILDHPKVQLMLLEYCLSRIELFNEYRDVITFYFLWSFYLETISFAGNYDDAFIPVEYFSFMQLACQKYCGDWRQNPFIKMLPVSGIKVLESIDHKFTDQNELNEFLIREKNCI